MNKTRKIVFVLSILTIFGLTINVATSKKTKSQKKPLFEQKKALFSYSMENKAKTGDLSKLSNIERLGKVENKIIKSKKLDLAEEKKLIDIAQNRTRYYSSVLMHNAILKSNDKLLSDSVKFIQTKGPLVMPLISSQKADQLFKKIKNNLYISTNLLFGAKLEKIIKKIRQILPAYKKLEQSVIRASEIQEKNRQIVEIATTLFDLEKIKEKKEKQKGKKELKKIGEQVKRKEEIGTPSKQFYFIDRPKTPKTPLLFPEY